jgi:hypothetical protein
MRVRVFGFSVLACLGLISLINAAPPAQKQQPIIVKPWVYDPDDTGIVDSDWVKGQGLPDAGSGNWALYLQKDGPTATNASGGASIDFQGKLTELGFDYRNDGHCGAGAPRFNVYDQNGDIHFIGCFYGTHDVIVSDDDDNPIWTRVRFTGADAFPPLAPTDTVTHIDIVFDEGTDAGPDFTGFVYLDNIDVNGVLVGKPGAGK